jgi:hypothetical protein
MLGNLDAERGQALQSTIKHAAPPRLSEIDDCQRRILDAAKAVTAA